MVDLYLSISKKISAPSKCSLPQMTCRRCARRRRRRMSRRAVAATHRGARSCCLATLQRSEYMCAPMMSQTLGLLTNRYSQVYVEHTIQTVLVPVPISHFSNDALCHASGCLCDLFCRRYSRPRYHLGITTCSSRAKAPFSRTHNLSLAVTSIT